MKRYRVAAGVAKFGPGQVMVLSKEQIEPRLAQLEVPKTYDGKEGAEVVTKTAVEFKVGEVLGLPELERRLVDVLIPLAAPQTETEQHAIDRERNRQAAERVAAAAAVKAAKEAAKKKRRR